eukprot:CAMPEP_0171490938 /NCGR_PEP_ID=MMETSP0958-20121227/3586_1 /TAXON_ID=87120 /ORGANISM="Aurantiochytrium limacinum, Strain ATCCMYA-1381" /LENGTH=78 /DNA_ID=CAMNT_0012024309 /DNA_START=67 /DNA_END=303 /DNA_ORIENTATION=+
MPLCFVVGAGMELFMIKVPIGGQTFYDVARRKSAERLEEELANEARARAEREARRKRLEAKYNMDLGNDISDEASPAQ